MEAADRYLTEYYSNYDEEGRLLSKHGRVEFLTTMRYMEKYLRPGMRILEVGAATGRYSHALAQRGYQVDAVELVDTETFKAFSAPWDIFELHRVEDIKALREQFPVEPLHLVATDGYTNHMRLTVEEMDEDTYALYLKYHLATCERQDMLGYSHHTLDIVRKR